MITMLWRLKSSHLQSNFEKESLLTQNFTASGYKRRPNPFAAKIMDVVFISDFLPQGTMTANINKTAGKDNCIKVSSGMLNSPFTLFKTLAILASAST